MKRQIAEKLFIFVLLVFINGCGSDKQTIENSDSSQELTGEKAILEEDKETKPEKILEETLKVETAPPPVAPPKTKEVEDKQETIAKAGPFYVLGCCKTKSQRSAPCCCNEVIEKYKGMKTTNDVKLADYNTTDPILGNCRKINGKRFEKIDYPIVEEEEDDEDNYDDLF